MTSFYRVQSFSSYATIQENPTLVTDLFPDCRSPNRKPAKLESTTSFRARLQLLLHLDDLKRPNQDGLKNLQLGQYPDELFKLAAAAAGSMPMRELDIDLLQPPLFQTTSCYLRKNRVDT